MTYKTQPIQFPLSQDKIYVARNGVLTKELCDNTDAVDDYPVGIIFEDSKFDCFTLKGARFKDGKTNPYDLIAEIIPEQKNWSAVVEKLYDALDKNYSWAHGVNVKWKDDAFRILQESETHNFAPQTHKVEGETHKLEFEIGELYEDRRGGIYEYMGANKYSKTPDKFMFIRITDGEIIYYYENGVYLSYKSSIDKLISLY